MRFAEIGFGSENNSGGDKMAWKHIEEAGVKWEARAIAGEPHSGEGGEADEVLEFRAAEGVFPPRRIAIKAGELASMDEAALRSAFARARPIGGDFYGRPGKRMTDVTSASPTDENSSEKR
jgi:hypothetical protein